MSSTNMFSASDIALLAEASSAGKLDNGIHALPKVISLKQSIEAPLLLRVQREGSDACQS
jgi:tRNA U38,U39,U40 pseudouridine synthase TruA